MCPRRSAVLAAGDRHPAAVVGDLDAGSVAGAVHLDAEPQSASAVLDGVRRQLADDGDDQRVVPAAGLGIDAQVDGEAAAPGRALGDRVEPAGEPAVLERGRMEAADRLAQPADCVAQLLPRALELARSPASAGVEVLAGGEQRLQRVVVEALGEPAPRPVLGRERVGEKRAAGLRQPTDPPPGGGERVGDEVGDEPDPEQRDRDRSPTARSCPRRLTPGPSRTDGSEASTR